MERAHAGSQGSGLQTAKILKCQSAPDKKQRYAVVDAGCCARRRCGPSCACEQRRMAEAVGFLGSQLYSTRATLLLAVLRNRGDALIRFS